MKYLYVSAVVPDNGRLWPLLKTLELAHAIEVTVRPVADEAPAKPASKPVEKPKIKRVRASKVLDAVRSATQPGDIIAASKLRLDGFTTRQISQALNNAVARGQAKRVGVGAFVFETTTAERKSA